MTMTMKNSGSGGETVKEEIVRLKGLCDPRVNSNEKEKVLDDWNTNCVNPPGQPLLYVSSTSGLYGIWPGSLRKGYTLLTWVRLPCSSNDEKKKLLLWSLSHSQGQLMCWIDNTTNASILEITMEVRWQSHVTPAPHACRATLATNNSKNRKEEEWILLGFHHALPYLSRPSMTVHVNGWEVGKKELAYPFQDSGDVKMEGFGNQIDVAALALFHQAIPGPIQSMAHEHGICEEIIPSHMPHASVTTHKDALISNHNNKTLGRHVGIPTTVGVLLSSMGDMTGDLLCTRLAQTNIGFLDIAKSSSHQNTNANQLLKIQIHMGPKLIGDLSSTPKLGLVSPTTNNTNTSSNTKSSPLLDDMERFTYVPDGVILPSHNNKSSYTVSQLLAIQPMHFFLLALYRALPPPSHLESKTWSLYRTQYKHVTAHNYKLFYQILIIVARLLNFHGVIRDDMLQQGQLHILWNTTLQLFNNNNNNEEMEDDTWYTSVKLPDMVQKGWEQIVVASCGQIIQDKDEKIPPPLHIRRTSDLALTVGMMTLDHMWHIMDPLYFATNLDYGWLWRPQLSVQYILTLLQNHNDNNNTILQESATSVLVSLLEYSLSSSKHASKGQDDVSACVAALTKSPSLGNIVSHVVIQSLYKLLQKGNALRSPQHPKELVPNNNKNNNNNNDTNNKTTIAETSMVNKLFRNLSTSQFHDVVAPMILSRSLNSNNDNNNNNTTSTNNDMNDHLWKQHWRWTLQIFIVSISILNLYYTVFVPLHFIV